MMAATLPEVAHVQHKSSRPARFRANKCDTRRVLSECMSKKEQELHERRLGLRAQLPVLSHSETETFHYSYKKNLCISILQQGYHKAFTEIFALIKQQEESRIKAGPDSELWTRKLLTDEHEKLRQLEIHLVAAEKALLKDDYMGAYSAHHTLAEYFSTEGDEWLADHFFQNCLRLGESVSQLDEGKTAADSHCNVGLCLQLSGKYDQAIRHFELFYQLTKNRSDWITEDGEMLLHSKSCHCLSRIYTIVAERFESMGDLVSNLQYLEQAYEMSKEGGDRKLCCEAGYRLGVSILKSGDARRALGYLQSYLDYCKSAGDKLGIGKACEALAKVYDSEGNVEESIKYLQQYIEVSEECGNEKISINAYNRLGTRYNTQGRYGKAVEYFNKSYNLARVQSDVRLVNSSRVLSGIAQAHNTLYNYKRHVASCDRAFTDRLLEWKNTRADDFDKIDEVKESASEELEGISDDSATAAEQQTAAADVAASDKNASESPLDGNTDRSDLEAENKTLEDPHKMEPEQNATTDTNESSSD